MSLMFPISWEKEYREKKKKGETALKYKDTNLREEVLQEEAPDWISKIPSDIFTGWPYPIFALSLWTYLSNVKA